ncbi:MAG: TetR/AcrR family transcriptional regulator [Pseudomonadales bacterium]
MSKSLWSGNRPASATDAKQRLCEAALECIKRNGLEKTSMSDIAKEAGVSRPTLYKYFKSKNDVFFAAIDAVAFSFAESVVRHAREFATVEERVIETIIYVVTELPRHRHLSLVINNECAAALSSRAFSDEATLVFSKMTAGPLIEIRPDLEEQGAEITEVMSRFAISMIAFPGRYSTDLAGLRELIRKRILPGLIQKNQ